MARDNPVNVQAAPDQVYRVELPRQCDAIGAVLRDAYDRESGIPDDMLILLRKMNGRPATSRDR